MCQIGLRRIGAQGFRLNNCTFVGILALSDMFPPIIPPLCGKTSLLHPWREHPRLAADRIVQVPRHDADQIHGSARPDRDLVTERGNLFFGKHVPSLEFDAHDDIDAFQGASHEPHVREGLGAPYEHAVFPFVFGIPDRPRPVERRHNLIFYGGSDKRVQIEQVGCLYPAEGMREIETHRKSLEGGDHSVVKPRFALSYTVGHIETRRTAYIVMHDVSPWSDSSRLTAWRYTSAFISAQ